MLLVRGSALIGESLSSYRQRIWARNGYRLFPVFHPELRRTDPDLQFRTTTLETVAREGGMTLEEIRALSLRSHPLLEVHGSMEKMNLPQWVVLLQYARNDLGAGSMFCPACLAEGEEPYFRAAWRMSASLACPIHRVQLLDRCPACSFPAWPYAAASAIGYFARQLDLDQCPRCLFRMRESPRAQEGDAHLLACAASMDVWRFPGGADFAEGIPLHEWFCGLRAIMNLALRSRSRSKLGTDEGFADVTVELDRSKIYRTPFDRLGCRYRRKLVCGAWPVMIDWPSRFLNFAYRNRITAADFSEDRPNLPSWFTRVVDVNLGQPGRLVTPAKVEEAIRTLELRGQSVSAESVGRLVGSRDAKPVQERLSRRKVATELEVAQLADGLRRYVWASTSHRKTAMFVRARNVAVVVVAILNKAALDEAASVSRTDLPRFLMPETVPSIPGRYLAEILEMALNAMAPFWAARSAGMDEAFFVPHRGASRNLRGAREALAQAMKGLDTRLRRCHRVFFDPA